jgi:hypothetical protein
VEVLHSRHEEKRFSDKLFQQTPISLTGKAGHTRIAWFNLTENKRFCDKWLGVQNSGFDGVIPTPTRMGD